MLLLNGPQDYGLFENMKNFIEKEKGEKSKEGDKVWKILENKH